MKMDLENKIIKNTYFLKKKISDEHGIVHYRAHIISRNAKVIFTFLPTPGSEYSLENLGYLKTYLTKLIKLNELNLVKYLEVGTYEERIFFVKESLTGTDLFQFRTKGGIKTVNDAVFLIILLSNALHKAHRLQISHNSLNPDSIFVLEQRGIATGVKIDGFETFLFQRKDQLQSTKQNRSSEPNDKIVRTDFSIQSDIISVGRIFYWLITGKFPDSVTNDKKKDHGFIEPSALNPEVPKILDTIIYRMLSSDPDLGYQDIEEYVKFLTLICRGEKIVEPKPLSGIVVEIEKKSDETENTVKIRKKRLPKKRKLSELLTITNDKKRIATEPIKREKFKAYDTITAKSLKALFAGLFESKGKLILIEKNDADAFRALFDYYYYYASYNNGIFINITLNENDSVNPYGLIKIIFNAYRNEIIANAVERNERLTDVLKTIDSVKLYHQNDLYLKLKLFIKEIDELNRNIEPRNSDSAPGFIKNVSYFLIDLLEIKKPLIIIAHQVEWIDDESNSFLAKLRERIARYPILIIGVYSKNGEL